FDAATIARLAGHFRAVLDTLARAPETAIATAPMMSPPELRQVLHDWNAAAAPVAQDRCIHELIAAQAAARPEAPAVVSEAGQWTYGALDTAANRLAHYLRGRGIGPETAVAVCL